jgi:hypothetical protein
MESEPESSQPQHRRSRRQGISRPRRIAISVSQAGWAELEQAARAEALTASAFVAEKALAAARRTVAPPAVPLREALADLNRATAQVQRVGTNLNQAVAALNTTGQPPGNLIQYAQYAAAVVQRMDQVVLRIRRQLP